MRRFAWILVVLSAACPRALPAGAERVYPESAFLHAGRGGHLIDVTKAPFFARGDGLHDDTAALRMALRFAREFTNVAHEPGGSVGGSPRRDLDGKGGVRDRLAVDFPKVDGENGFEVSIRTDD